MTTEEILAYETTMKTQHNCALNPEYFFKMPPTPTDKKKVDPEGFNVLHFNSGNRPLRSTETEKFIREHLRDAVTCKSDVEVMMEAVKEARRLNDDRNRQDRRDGVYLEFGFCTGRSINFMAALGYDKKIFGFDSTDGLPSDWEGKEDRFPKGTFRYLKSSKKIKVKGADDVTMVSRDAEPNADPFIPFIPLENVKLILGEIKATLPTFKEFLVSKNYHLDLVHIDTDLYSSCKSIYWLLDDLIEPERTVVVLDEGYNWVGQFDEQDAWRHSEIKATVEFAERNRYRVKYLAYNYNHQQLALTFIR